MGETRWKDKWLQSLHLETFRNLLKFGTSSRDKPKKPCACVTLSALDVWARKRLSTTDTVWYCDSKSRWLDRFASDMPVTSAWACSRPS